MSHTYSNTFSFKTVNSHKKDCLLNNILFINNINDSKYTVEYFQYNLKNKEQSAIYKYKKLTVDRLYFLEMANMTVDDYLRSDKFFSVLGKRQFSANKNSVDFYLLNNQISREDILKDFKQYRLNNRIQTYYYKSVVYAENQFTMVLFKSIYGYFIFLNQVNISPRRTIKKSFVLEVTLADFSYHKQLKSAEQKVEYFFNKVGKICFNAQELIQCRYENEQSLMKEILSSKINKNDNTREYNYKLNDKISEDRNRIKKIGLEVYESTYLMMKNVNDESIQNFCSSCILFTRGIKNISDLDDLNSYITAIVSFAQEGKLGYLLEKNDSDFSDIFLYALELFAKWIDFITEESSVDEKLLLRQQIDLSNSLKHLIDSYLEFNYEYQIKDAKALLNKVKINDLVLLGPKKVSAKEFFDEIELEADFVDELNELDEEVQNITVSSMFDLEMQDGLVKFFEGYARMLNSFYEFKDLGYSLTILSTKLKNYEDEDKYKLLVILLALVDDLISWKQQVFIDRTADWIHYMDSSFYSNISQMEILLNNENSLDSEIEFF